MVKGSLDEYSALADLLESIGRFLEIGTEIPLAHTEAVNEMMVKILVELLSTLALITKGTKQGKLSECIIGEEIYYLTCE